MIKIYCDLCGKEIKGANEQVNIDFNSYGITGFKNNGYQLHVECAVKVKGRMDDLLMGTPKEGKT